MGQAVVKGKRITAILSVLLTGLLFLTISPCPVRGYEESNDNTNFDILAEEMGQEFKRIDELLGKKSFSDMIKHLLSPEKTDFKEVGQILLDTVREQFTKEKTTMVKLFILGILSARLS